MASTATGGKVTITTIANTEVQIGPVFQDAGNYVIAADINNLPDGEYVEIIIRERIQEGSGFTARKTRYGIQGAGHSWEKIIETQCFCITEGYMTAHIKATVGSISIPCTVKLADG